MFRHLLVPLDLSDRSGRVLEIARAIAASANARMTLLHVVQRIDGIPAAELRRFYTRLEARAQRRLARLAREAPTDGRAPVLRVVVGDPATEILREVRARKADLIVLGSHRLAQTPGMGLGTTSYRVGIVCPCPVLLVK